MLQFSVHCLCFCTTSFFVLQHGTQLSFLTKQFIKILLIILINVIVVTTILPLHNLYHSSLFPLLSSSSSLSSSVVSPRTTTLPPSLEVVIVTYVQIDVKGFAVTVTIRGEHVLMERPIHTNGNDRVDIFGCVLSKRTNTGTFSGYSETGQ